MAKPAIFLQANLGLLVDGEFERIIGDHFPLQGFYPTNRWLPGDIIRDQINLSIPFDYSAERYTVYVGFFMGDQRQAVLPGFPQDGANRVRAGTLDLR